MPFRLAIVHDVPTFLVRAAAVLRRAGFDVIVFSDPMVALDANIDEPIGALVTRVTFPEGEPHGVSLALMLRARHPGLKVVFATRAEWIEHTKGIGELVPHPVDLEKLVEAVKRAVGEEGGANLTDRSSPS